MELAAVRQRWLGVANSVTPIVRAEAATTEANANLSGSVVHTLRDAELFSVFVPSALGGGEVDLVTGLQIIEILSRADGSTGWTLMAGITGAALACAYLSDTALSVIFANGKLPLIAGMVSPGGTATPVAGGYAITGNFRFGSGITHADWVSAGAFVRVEGRTRMLASGSPDMRAFFMPRSAVELRGNWDVLGLVGTGSVDYHIDAAVVPDHMSLLLPEPAPTRATPAYQIGLAALGGAGHGAVALGIAMRAVEEIAGIAQRKRRSGQTGVVDQQLFLHGFAEHEAYLQAARAFFYGVFQEADNAVRSDGTPGSLGAVQRQRLRQAITHSTNVAADVVRWCYNWSGSDGLRNPSPLGRCLRDISAATQHVFVDPNTLVNVAPDLLAEWTG